MTKHFTISSAALLAVTITLTACSSQNSLINKPGATTEPPPLSAPITNSAATPMPDQPPYVLTAQSSGQFIDFSIYNMGSSDLQVDKSNFAIINANSREVVPYDNENAIIDIPPSAIIKPNETLNGRAIFNAVNSPAGRRLVFKPDATGTFADINPAHKTH